MKDQEIILLFRQRDEKALLEISKKYQGYCHTISMNILQNSQDAEECVNDTLQRAWDAIPPAAPACLRAYLGKLARNLALDRCRAARAQKRGAGRYEAVFSELEQTLSAGDPADESLDRMTIRTHLQLFLESLPAEHRRMFLQRYWYFSSLSEIAHTFHCSESRVQSILYRARQKLKTQLETEGVLP